MREVSHALASLAQCAHAASMGMGGLSEDARNQDGASGPKSIMRAAAGSITRSFLTPTRSFLTLREQSRLRSLSSSSLCWEPASFEAMSPSDKKHQKITHFLNLDAKIQAKKQHDLLAAMPDGSAKTEMRRVLKMNKLLGEGGAARAVQGRQFFHVIRQRSTDGGKTLPFTLQYALVSEINHTPLGNTVQVEGKKWPTWKVLAACLERSSWLGSSCALYPNPSLALNPPPA